MSIEKALNFSDGYGNYSGDAKPTTYADMYRYMGNQNNVLTALASLIWQPSTAYKVGDVVQAPEMNGYHARCTNAGTSSSDVPTWTAGGTVTDGTVTWTMERQSDINAAQTATNQTLSNNLTNWTHQLKRSTAYAVGDVAYSPNLKSYLYLECTTAGTTSATEPTLSSVAGGATVTDGTVKWAVRDKRMSAMVDMFYPVGSVYMTVSNTKPAFMSYGTWTEVASDKVLQGASSSHAAGSTVAAGLPDIVGTLGVDGNSTGALSGAFSKTSEAAGGATGTSQASFKANFSAKNSNAIYGNSSTVQPPAYIVHVYQRTA